MPVLNGAAKVLCLLEEMWYIKVKEYNKSDVGFPSHFFSPRKIYWKDYWEKINIDIVS